MANKLAKIIITGPLPLQAWNQLRWAPVHWPPTSAGLTSTMVGPSTGGPNLRTGPLPLQARKQLSGGPSTGGPNQSTGPLPLQAGQHYGGPHHWRPKPTHWPPSSAGLKSTKTCSLPGHGNKQHKCQQHNPLLHSIDGPPHNPLITPSHPHHWHPHVTL